MGSVKANATPKRAANVSIRQDVLATAKALKINLSQAAERGILEAVKEKQAEQWAEDNRAALESSNAYVEAHGLPLEKYRRF